MFLNQPRGPVCAETLAATALNALTGAKARKGRQEVVASTLAKSSKSELPELLTVCLRKIACPHGLTHRLRQQ